MDCFAICDVLLTLQCALLMIIIHSHVLGPPIFSILDQLPSEEEVLLSSVYLYLNSDYVLPII